MLGMLLTSACAHRAAVIEPPRQMAVYSMPDEADERPAPVLELAIGDGAAPPRRAAARQVVRVADPAAFQAPPSLPLCAELGARASQANCNLRKRFGSIVQAGNILDRVPDDLTVGKTADFEVTFATNAASAEAAAQLGSATVGVTESVLTPVISAQIYGGGMRFTPDTPVEQKLEFAEKLTWHWSGVPGEAGPRTITVKFEMKDKDGRKINEYLHKIEVSVGEAVAGSTISSNLKMAVPQEPKGFWDTWPPRIALLISILTGALGLPMAIRKYWSGNAATSHA